jgi:hypothetical protein
MILRGFDLSGSRFVVAMRLGKPQTRCSSKSIASRRQSFSCKQGEWWQSASLQRSGCAGVMEPAGRLRVLGRERTRSKCKFCIFIYRLYGNPFATRHRKRKPKVTISSKACYLVHARIVMRLARRLRAYIGVMELGWRIFDGLPLRKSNVLPIFTNCDVD